MNKETVRILEKAMSHEIVTTLVQEATERIWHSIPDETSFEHTCYRNIGEELMKGNVESVEAMARYYIRRAKARHLGITKYERATTFSELSKEGSEDSEDIEFEPEDVLANVESEVIAKEMIALLAQDDHRKKEILGHWAIGNTNHAHISRSLARTMGGNAETHRRAINRFRKDCPDILAEAI